MIDEASQRPWTHADTGSRGCIILDATGRCLANTQYGVKNDMETNRANAALIVDAVNERDRLRDLVKRMIPFVEKCHSDALDISKTIKGICALKCVDTSEIDRINSEHDALIAEARAAIGEDKE